MFSAKRPTVTVSQDTAPASPQKQNPTALLPVRVPTTSELAAPAPTTPNLTTPLEIGAMMSGRTSSLEGSTSNRVPIVIKRELKRPEPLSPLSREARRKHSKRLWILGSLMLVITLAATLLSFTPQGREITTKFNPNQMANQSTVISNKQNAAQVAALATETWMYQNDGEDPYANGQVTVSNGSSSLPWPYGQCTSWANSRYHQLTGFWVQWAGNADQWFLGAQEAGWDYGQTPPSSVPSIIMLMPYVQGASWLGHVAVVESISGNIVHTSNMNWGYYGYTHVEYVDFTLGSGVYFLWHKPKN